MGFRRLRLIPATVAVISCLCASDIAFGQATVTDESSLNQAFSDNTYDNSTITFSPGLDIDLTAGVDGTAGPSGYIIDGQGGNITGDFSHHILNSGGKAVEGLLDIEINRGTSNAPDISGGFTAGSVGDAGFSNAGFNNNTNTSGSGGGALIQGDFGQTGGAANGITGGSRFIGNIAGEDGGGLAVLGDFYGGLRGENGQVSFQDNQSWDGNGGGMFVYGDFIGDIYSTSFSGNIASENGGGLYVGGDFTGNIREDSYFTNNNAGKGGGLYVQGDFGGSLWGLTARDNEADSGSGGAVWLGSLSGDLNGTFRDNSAAGSGGAVFVESGDIGGVSGIYSGNTTGRHGGAIYVNGLIGNMAATGLTGTFSGNHALENGGAVYATGIDGGIKNAAFTGNTAGGTYGDLNTSGHGGAVFIDNGTIGGGINNSRFENNTANGEGGAVWADEISGGISNSTFINNKAWEEGGAVYIEGDLDFLTSSVFTGNETDSGSGGGLNIYGDLLSGLDAQTRFENNRAGSEGQGGDGGGLQVFGKINGDVRAYFSNNYAGTSGGGLRAGNIDGFITGTIIENNTAGQDGGGVYVASRIEGIAATTFRGNTATGGSGGALWAYTIGSGLDGDTYFINNKAELWGGALYLNDGIYGDVSSTFSGNSAGCDGGAILTTVIDGSILGATFQNNSAGEDGGALMVFDKIRSVDGSSFIGNTAGYSGGAIYANNIEGGIIGNSLFRQNTAELNGGAVYVSTTIDGDVSAYFDRNSSGQNGGALYAVDLTGNIINSTFTGNIAAQEGGGIYVTSDIQGVSNSTFENNQALGGSGGAVHSVNIDGNIQNSIFRGNSAAQDGGALYLTGDVGRLNTVLFENNAAMAGSGGAIYIQNLNSGLDSTVAFSGNRAGLDGGSLYVADTINGNIEASIYNSQAGGDGGAIYTGTINGGIKGATYSGNSAGGAGGAIYVQTLTGGIAKAVFSGNSATSGGALSIGELTGDIVDSIFTGNNAGDKGGAVYIHGNSNFAITATAGNSTVFQNNTHGSLYRALNSSVTSNSLYFDGGQTDLRVGGAGSIYFYDPIAVGGGLLNYTHDDLGAGGRLHLYQVNEILGGEANFNFFNGTTILNPDYVLTALNDSTLNVQIGSDTPGHMERLTMDLYQRDPNLAIINYAGADGLSSSFSAGSNLVLIAPRTLLPQVGRYLLVDGGDVDLPDQAALDHIRGTVEEQHEYKAELLYEAETNRIWLVAEHNPDVGNPGENGNTGLPGLEEWLRGTDPGLSVRNSDLFYILKQNVRKVSPEPALTMAWAETRRHTRAAEFAVNQAFMTECPDGLNCGRDFDRKRTWISYFGDYSHALNTDLHYGYKQYSNGFLMGALWETDYDFTAGVYGGYSKGRADFNDIDANVRTDTFHAGLYGRYYWPQNFSLTLDLAHSWHDNSMNRNVGGLGWAKSNFDQNITSLGLEGAYDWKIYENFCLTPFVSVRQSWLRQDGLTESGAILTAALDSFNYNNFSTNLGVKAAGTMVVSDQTTIKPFASVSWWHDYGDKQLSSTANFTTPLISGGQAQRFAVTSRQSSSDAALLNIGVDTDSKMANGNSLGFKLSYGLELREKVDSHSLYGGLEFKF